MAFADLDRGTPIIPAALASASNLTLNIYATLFIAIRLIRHRRLAIVCFGSAALTMQHLRIVGILLESAAINVPILLAAVVGAVTQQVYGTFLFGIAVTCQVSHPNALPVFVSEVGICWQSFSTMLILYQVALGKAIGQATSEPGATKGLV